MSAIAIELADGRMISGHCDAQFTGVLAEFRRNFEERKEVGASVAITLGGRSVVDLWGGLANAQTGEAWGRDTIGIVYSCTKAATALCLHMLVDQGKVSYETSVGEIWPEFASAGKEATTVAMMLSHTSPVPHVREAIRKGGLADWDYMTARVAAEAAHWEPGTRQGYHGLTYAWTVGQLVRLVAGVPMGQYFRENVAGPLGLDFHIGLPESEEARVAPMIAADPAEVNFASDFFRKATTEPGSLPNLFLTNQGGANFNSREIHAAEIGSANGITNARGLAGMYAPLATGGGNIVSADRVHRMGRVCAATQSDAVLCQPMRFAMGFMASTDNRPTGGDSLILGESAFGHVGMGGSVGFADPAAGLSMGYTMNRMGAGILVNTRGQALIDAAYRAVGMTSDESGAWR
ncbi:EstA family serine hydrolase [Novosphingobium sediminis]|uniref:EstA family serine hydrolase n=1 Tax=Novosphingobium sediminis TaxID=707214 RepID=A0A512AMD4_9SPHN|nr:serine hydrolase domain-containing protein [Novosphingobium sediminis]GEO00869.1 EstA family serine hydrolase [Novosphingobium sediminis]